MASGIRGRFRALDFVAAAQGFPDQKEEAGHPVLPSGVEQLVTHLSRDLGIRADHHDLLQKVIQAFTDWNGILEASVAEKIAKKSAYKQAQEAFLAASTLAEESFDVSIERVCRPYIQKVLNDKRIEKILEAREASSLEGLSEPELLDLYKICIEESRLVSAFKHQLDQVFQNARLTPEQARFAEYRITHSKVPARPILIYVPSLNMGYSIFELLKSISILSGDFDAQDRFILSKEETIKLTEHLEQVNLWNEDFASIFGELVANNLDEAQQFYHTACKSMSEIIKNPIFMTPRAKSLLRTCQEGVVILFNHIAIDLTRHPEKEFYKELLEGFYRLEKLTGANQLDKEFMHGTFLSNLNVRQLEQICPHLNKQLVLKRLAFEFFGLDTWRGVKEALPLYGIENELEILKQTKIPLVQALFLHAVHERERKSLETVKGLREILAQLQASTSVQQIERESISICQRVIKTRTGVALKSRAPLYEASQEQIRALYERSAPTVGVFHGLELKNTAALFFKLKSSPLVRACIADTPAYSEAIQFLEDEFARRYREYHTLSETGFYGRAMVRLSVDLFENLVTKVTYAERYQFDAYNIDQMLKALVGICNTDLRNCAQGFSGRIQDVVIALDASRSGDTLEDAIYQLFADKGREWFGKATRYEGQSSHLGGSQAAALAFLGQRSSGRAVSFEELDRFARQAVEGALSEIDSFFVYQIAYDWVTKRFWKLNTDSDHEQIYELLKEVGFGENREELHKKFKVFSDEALEWQYAFFQQALPEKLVEYLIKKGFLFIKPRPDEGAMFSKEGVIRRVAAPALAAPPAQLAQPLYQPPAAAAALVPPPRGDAGAQGLGQRVQSALPKLDVYTG